MNPNTTNLTLPFSNPFLHVPVFQVQTEGLVLAGPGPSLSGDFLGGVGAKCQKKEESRRKEEKGGPILFKG